MDDAVLVELVHRWSRGVVTLSRLWRERAGSVRRLWEWYRALLLARRRVWVTSRIRLILSRACHDVFNAFLPDVLPCLTFRNAPTPVMICLNEVSSLVEESEQRVSRLRLGGKVQVSLSDDGMRCLGVE